jgi:hypothetical protein
MTIIKRIALIALAVTAAACGQPPCDPAATTVLQGTVYDCRP